MQAAVSGAVSAVLRRHAAATALAGDQASHGRLADCVHMLCRWRDYLAREEDESEPHFLQSVPSLNVTGVSLDFVCMLSTHLIWVSWSSHECSVT